MNLIEEAIVFATKAHEGQERKLAHTPYILHPLEVACIISTITADPEIIAAGILHDTVEDCGTSPDLIREKFGDRVAQLVLSETEKRTEGVSPEASWTQRKQESIERMRACDDPAVKILWMGDKLSNIRSFYRGYRKVGNDVFSGLHQRDPKMHGWYYRTIADALSELSDTAAYEEYTRLLNEIFGEKEGK